MRIALFIVGVLFLAGTASADTFVDGVRYETGQTVSYQSQACDTAQSVFVSAGSCSTPQSASACSQSQSQAASACGSASSARSARTGPVRRLFGGLFRGRRAGGC